MASLIYGEGETEGSFDRRAPRLHEMEGRRGGGNGFGQLGSGTEMDDDASPSPTPFCGVFQPKLMDLIIWES